MSIIRVELENLESNRFIHGFFKREKIVTNIQKNYSQEKMRLEYLISHAKREKI